MSTPKPPKTIRDNEFSADYLLWQASISGNNDEQLARLKKNLRQAQLDALTDRQREMVQMYYGRNMTMGMIALALHVNRSTVSRNLSRARKRLGMCLKYSW